MTSISKTISDATSTVKDTMKSAISLGKNLGITGNKDVGQLYYEGTLPNLSVLTIFVLKANFIDIFYTYLHVSYFLKSKTLKSRMKSLSVNIRVFAALKVS